MNLLEYEAKRLLSESGLTVPKSYLISSRKDLAKLSVPVMLKLQVPTGGRGKAGGIVLVHRQEKLSNTYTLLCNLKIQGFSSDTVLAEEVVSIKKEIYISLVVDRTEQSVILMAGNKGGIDIEQTAANEDIKRFILDTVPNNSIITSLYSYFDIPLVDFIIFEKFVKNMWHALKNNDALLLEINPLIITSNNEIICGDAKMELDNSAKIRHRSWNFIHMPDSAQFVIIDASGDVATMANGAGLAMGTVDAVKAAGLKPANFLDIGGGTSASSIKLAFNEILKISSVSAIVINIFAGISRCDEVANAIVEAKQSYKNMPALFIRLSGTNSVEGIDILNKNKIKTVESLEQAVELAVKVVTI